MKKIKTAFTIEAEIEVSDKIYDKIVSDGEKVLLRKMTIEGAKAVLPSKEELSKAGASLTYIKTRFFKENGELIEGFKYKVSE